MLARELGLTELSPEYWGFYNKQNQCQGFPNTAVQMCEKWMLEPFDGKLSADRVIKARLSLVEIGFRQHETFVAGLNAKLAEKIAAAEKFDLTFSRNSGLWIQGSNSANGVRAANANSNAKFQMAVNELNARFRQANCQLHYHNGFIQNL